MHYVTISFQSLGGKCKIISSHTQHFCFAIVECHETGRGSTQMQAGHTDGVEQDI